MIRPQKPAPPPRARPAGMSLLEMLVVFVLVSLLSVLVVQGTGFFLGGYQAAVRGNRTEAQTVLQRSWFMESLRGMVASQLAAQRFRGTAETLEGTTLQPLVAESGVPVKVRWTVRQQDSAGFALAYEEGENPETGIAWTLRLEEARARQRNGASALAFQYADRTGAWQDAWPLPRSPREYLPSAVRLVSETGETVWFVYLDLHYEPAYEDDELASRIPQAPPAFRAYATPNVATMPHTGTLAPV